MSRVVDPLSTTLVPGSPTVDRTPASAVAAPAYAGDVVVTVTVSRDRLSRRRTNLDGDDPLPAALLAATHALLRGLRSAGLDAQQLQYVNQIESGYAKRIFELLEPIVGHDNLRASVTADIDFSQSEATSEEFKPNKGADASVSIRSEQTSDAGGGAGAGALPSGVPGAASNQPPIAATAPLTGASQALQAAPVATAGTAGAGGSRS